MLKLGKVTKVKVLFPLLVFVFDFDLFEFSAAILEKGLLRMLCRLLVDVNRCKFWSYLPAKNIPPIVTQNDSLVDSTDIGDDIWRRTGAIRYI